MLLMVVCNTSPDRKESPNAGADPVVGTVAGVAGVAGMTGTAAGTGGADGASGADSGAGAGGSAGAWVVISGVLDDVAAGAGVGLGFQLENCVGLKNDEKGK
jgi:hypothetical protein